ncbi:dihydroorotate dehydrogenase electron transfer subunit [archaeon]|nr:MAG: dihydroorotate dehydrogenase electron transfer subunit [archaeon]
MDNLIYRTVKVAKIRREACSVYTVKFKDPLTAKATPGQFVMINVIGVDEFPMSLSYIGEISGVTFKVIGEGTQALSEVKVGEYIGIKGPLGHGFQIDPRDRLVLVVGGGIGLAPLIPLIEKLIENGVETKVVFGVRSSEDIFFRDRLSALVDDDLIIVTEDGSYGVKGTAPKIARKLVRENHFSRIYACGPEKMLYKVFRIAVRYGVKAQFSLERYMKCGVGLCGNCCLDPLGLLACRDGPVFDVETLKKISDFGRFKRDPSGMKIKV